MAGGTGGHIFPGLAVADYLKGKGWRVVWLGTKNGMEAALVPKQGYEIEWLTFSGVRESGLLRWMTLPFFLLLACVQSAAALRRRRPDVVLGMGGFAAFPGGLMACFLNKPLIIHEQNSIAGLANRVLSGLADRVLVGFPDAFSSVSAMKPSALSRAFNSVFRLQSSVIWSGNPVRQDIASLPAPDERFRGREGRLKLLVVGGSQGAQALNQTVPQALKTMPEDERPHVVHQAGARHSDEVNSAYTAAGIAAQVLPFLDDIAVHYARCDVVLCRAGALTIAELTAAGVASILVPYPHAVDDHQTRNARFLSEKGAAFLVPQTQFDPQGLAKLLGGFTRGKLLEMAQRARALAMPEATRLVAETCMELAK